MDTVSEEVKDIAALYDSEYLSEMMNAFDDIRGYFTLFILNIYSFIFILKTRINSHKQMIYEYGRSSYSNLLYAILNIKR